MMDTEEFGKRYLQYEQDIEKVLRGLKIYDEDLMHDTYIALYEHSQEAEIGDFVDAFVAFYKARYKRRGEHESYYVTCDNQTMVEKYDRIDEDDWEYREQLGDKIDKLMAYYRTHPSPGEHNHERSCEVLTLYRSGLSNVDIAKTLKIDESTVRRYIKRAILGLKSPSKMAI